MKIIFFLAFYLMQMVLKIRKTKSFYIVMITTITRKRIQNRLSMSSRGLRSWMPFPGNGIFPKKFWEISHPQHSGSSSSRSRLSPVIWDWMLPGLVLGWETFRNSQTLPAWKLIYIISSKLHLNKVTWIRICVYFLFIWLESLFLCVWF